MLQYLKELTVYTVYGVFSINLYRGIIGLSYSSIHVLPSGVRLLYGTQTESLHPSEILNMTRQGSIADICTHQVQW